MSNTDQALREEANWCAQSIIKGPVAERANGPAAHVRAMTFQPRVNYKPQCPRCWVRNEVKSPLTSIPGTDDYDMLRCGVCGGEFLVPM